MKLLPAFFAILAFSCGTQPTANTRDSLAASSSDTVQTATNNIILPPPYETQSVINASDVIGWGENVTPVAPSGFKVTMYAGELDNPRWLYVLPNGDVLVAEAKKSHPAKDALDAITGKNKEPRRSELANRITLLRDADNDGIPELRSEFLHGLNRPFGMVLLNNYIYIANTDALWRYPYTAGATQIIAAGEKLADLPGEGRHWTRNVITNPEGNKLYISVGSGSDHAEGGIEKEFHRACILECNPDGSDLRVFADGLRNPVGMDWSPGSNTLWTVVNERDELGDHLVPDFLTRVQDGGFYGWPYSYFGQHTDPRISKKNQRPDLVTRAIVPDVSLGAHVAALGLCFYDLKSFPAKYHNGTFIGLHGSWNSSELVGYKVVFVPFQNGQPSGPPEDFLTGFIADASKDQVYGRPVGVAVLPDGSLLVADDAGNTVWRVEYIAK